MKRVIEPLMAMGASIKSTSGHAPIHIQGGQILQGITYTLPVASAQVKSCLLLAGLYAQGDTEIIEPVLQTLGAHIEKQKRRVLLHPCLALNKDKIIHDVFVFQCVHPMFATDV